MESAQLSSSQLTRVNHVHFKSIRRIFGIKSPFYHRVLNPTTADCSNEYLTGLAKDTLRVVCPSQIYSQNRLALLGHLFRHDDSIEYHATFMSAGRDRQVRGPATAGRPRLHWAESTMTEDSHRIEHLQSDAAPSHSDIRHSFFQLPSLNQIKTPHTISSVIGMENLSLYRSLRPAVLQRKHWAKLVHKPPRKTPSQSMPVQTAEKHSLRREKTYIYICMYIYIYFIQIDIDRFQFE